MRNKENPIKLIYSNFSLEIENAEHFIYLARKLEWDGSIENHTDVLDSLLGRITFMNVSEFEHDFALLPDLTAISHELSILSKSEKRILVLDDCNITFKRENNLLKLEFADGYKPLVVSTDYHEFREFVLLSIDLVMNYYKLKITGIGKTLDFSITELFPYQN